jgi:protein-disulfide isomerase
MENKKDGFTLSTPVAILLAGILVAAALLYALVYVPAHPLPTTAGQQQNGGAQQAPGAKAIAPITAKDHVRGDSKTAQLTLVEYSDLQCPYCSQFHPVMQQLKNEYGNKIAWSYRHFPLSQIHPQALPAAVASECVAAAKGNDAFWTFIDGVFADQKNIGTTLFHTLAAKVGMSASDLDACIAKNNTAAIEASYNEAVAAGGNGTPFTVILDKNGKTVGTFPGSMPYASAKAQVDALLATVK